MKTHQKLLPKPSKREAVLEQRRTLKMAQSAHAYVRGSTVRFYAWLEQQGARAVPKGPPVWICGDCHAGNLGPLADAKGKIHVQIRDVDQTVIGNPHHDLIRLALSLATAARGSDLPGVTTAHMLEQMSIGYQRALRGPRAQDLIESDKPESIKVVMRKAMSRTWKHLARERLKELKPKIPRGERFWPLAKQEDSALAELFARDEVRQLVTLLKSRSKEAVLEVLDAAYWMKGCSSLGRLRYAVLLNISTGERKEDEFCLIRGESGCGAPQSQCGDAQGSCAAGGGRGAPSLASLGRSYDGSETAWPLGGAAGIDAAGFEVGNRSSVAPGSRELRPVFGGSRRQGACPADGCGNPA